MVNICFITYYGIREQLQCVSDSLTKTGHKMFNFSLMENENNENREIVYDMLIDTIKKNFIDVVLWWYMGSPVDKMRYVVNSVKDVKHMMYNWDDPNGWKSRCMASKAELLDCVFTCCKDVINSYLHCGTKNAFYLLPGYDPKINFIQTMPTNEYDCDISFICTNLYEKNTDDMNQYIIRKELIDKIYANRDKYKFNIYGPEYLNDLYPESYKRYDDKIAEIPYAELNKIFNSSKINICTHTHCQYNGYLNERTILILGSGGLLFVDPVCGIENTFVNGVDCVYIDKNNYINQICDIIENYDDYYEIRNNGHEKSLKYTWDEWAKKINDEYLIKIHSIEQHTSNQNQNQNQNHNHLQHFTNLSKNLPMDVPNNNFQTLPTENPKNTILQDDEPTNLQITSNDQLIVKSSFDRGLIKINISVQNYKNENKDIEINIQL